MSEENNKPNDRPNNEPNGGPKHDSGDRGRINEGIEKGQSSDIGGGKADSGEFGRGFTKPGGKPKEEK